MLTPKLLSLLWCPTCRAGELISVTPGGESEDEGELQCRACGTTFPVRFGFPILIPKSALSGAEWIEWRDHLERLQVRRAARIENPREALNRLAKKSRPQKPFAAFAGIDEGTVLDVGCGPGKFRFNLDADRVDYVGLDPITLPDVSDFPFVQGVAEYLPFREHAFTDIVVLAALDHFRDVERFLGEAQRVLEPGGTLHVMQSIHEIRGPISALKVLAHEVKDALEDRATDQPGRSVPKHLTEFTSESLIDRMSGAFELVSMERYSPTWYSPMKLFMSFSSKEASSMARVARSA